MDNLTLDERGDYEIITKDGVKVFESSDPEDLNSLILPVDKSVDEIAENILDDSKISKSINSDVLIVSKEPVRQQAESLGAAVDKILRFSRIKDDMGNVNTPGLKKAAAVFLAPTVAFGAIYGTMDYAHAGLEFDRQDAEVVAGNALFYGLISGLSAKMYNEPFWPNFAKGASGGAIIGAGKWLVGQDDNLAWPAKLIVSTGSSIASNAAQGKDILDTVGIDFGPLYLILREDGINRPRAQIELASTIDTMFILSQGYDLDLKDSLKYGTPIYYTDGEIDSSMFDKRVQELNIRGGVKTNNVLLSRMHVNSELIRHELIHTHQYRGNMVIGRMVDRALDMGLDADYTRQRKSKINVDGLFGALILTTPQIGLPYKERSFEIEAHKLTE